ncbi:tetratricopeptide repeat protein, partial [Desulfobacterales bacterium HSG17]|nr:tetratricopeptide repeat protein [Desulfobacterales bacterium HSG17]
SICFPVQAQNKTDTQKKGQIYYNSGAASFKAGKYLEAEKNLKAAVEAAPGKHKFNKLLAMTYLKMKNYDLALKYFQIVRKLKPATKKLTYFLGRSYYGMADYATASKLFAQVVKRDPFNSSAQYYLSLSLCKLERCTEAEESIEESKSAVRKKDVINSAYLNAGMCYLKKWEFDKAAEKFRYVEKNAKSKKLGLNAKKLIELTDKQRKVLLKPYTVLLKLSGRFDDNVTLVNDDDESASGENDFISIALFSGSYKFLNKKNYQAGAGYSYYGTWYSDLSQYDLSANIFNAFAKYQLNDFSFDFDYSPSKYQLDSKSYMTRHQLKPRVSWDINEHFKTGLTYSYTISDYAKNDDKDGHANAISVNGYYSLPQQLGLVFAGIGYEDITATNAHEYYDQIKANIGVSFRLPWKLKLGIQGKYYKRDYNKIDLEYSASKDYKKYSGNISFSRKIYYDWLKGSFDYDYTKKDSNISAEEYNKNMFTFSLMASY